jgi:hypothetical protein
MSYYLGGTGYIFPDKIIQGQYASNSVDASKINMFHKNENYGISTSNPQFSLDVNGTIKTNSALIIGSSTYTDVNLNNTSNTAYFASNLSVYSSNNLNTKLNLSGGTMTGALTTSSFTVNNQIAKFQNGNSLNAVFVESSVGAYFGKCGISFNGYSSGNNNQNFVNSSKSKWSMSINQYGTNDTMDFHYFTPNSTPTNGYKFLSFSNVGSCA